MLDVAKLVLGPVQTNTYLLADPQTGEAAVIDPAESDDRDCECLSIDSGLWNLAGLGIAGPCRNPGIHPQDPYI